MVQADLPGIRPPFHCAQQAIHFCHSAGFGIERLSELVLPGPLQAQAVYKKNDKAVQNMQALVNMSTRAVAHRWSKYDELFESVRCTVSEKFHGYMWKRGHQVRLLTAMLTGCLALNSTAAGALNL